MLARRLLLRVSPARGSHRLVGTMEHWRYLKEVGGRGPRPRRRGGAMASYRRGKVQAIEMAKAIQECDASSCRAPAYKGIGRPPILGNF
jgi:hypothetical protein